MKFFIIFIQNIWQLKIILEKFQNTVEKNLVMVY